VPRPRLSWTLESSERAQHQTAYQVLVASSPEELADDQSDLWDSGKVASNQSAYVRYAGNPLQFRRVPECDQPRWHPLLCWVSGLAGLRRLAGVGWLNDRFGITPKELLGTAFFAYSSRLLAQIAHVLGKSADADRYGAMFQKTRQAFQARFVTAGGLIAGGTQTCYVLALHFDLLPAELRPAALAELVRDIERRGMHLSTGFVGTPYINWVLSENGRTDVAYKPLKQTAWPSWLYSVTQGATTIWERWVGWTHDKGFQDPSMNSFNHYAYGAIGAWIFAVVGGIDVDPEQPGYKHIVMRPRPGGELTHATTELRSIYGPIRSAWTLENGRFDWQIAVPANSTATVYVPSAGGTTVHESGNPAPRPRA
jgi:alpha-L-rhamnosidase